MWLTFRQSEAFYSILRMFEQVGIQGMTITITPSSVSP